MDLDRLLLPISETAPGGEWLRYSDTYDAIQEARRADDPSLPQGIWQRELKKADWGRLAGLCEDAIQYRSKDLYIAVWLVEAWLHEHGIAGIASGMELLCGLCDQYWEELYPRIDPVDPDVRAAPFEWLNDKIPVALRTVPVSRPESQDALPVAWAEVLASRAGARVPKRDPKKPAVRNDEVPAAARVATSVSLTPSDWFRGLAGQVEDAVDATQRLMILLQERAPEAPPSLRRIEESLQDMQRWVNNIVGERPMPFIAPLPSENEEVSTPEEVVSMPPAEDGVVRSREDAYRLLSIAAEYLLRTEPHSPTPYLVQRAVNWGKMPLGELLEEYSHDGNDLRMLRLLLGINQ